MPSLILASGSPRRSELFTLGGWKFAIRPAQVEEIPRDGESPANFALRMAEEKARAVLTGISGQTIIIGADTIVVNSSDGNPSGKHVEIMGKPADEAEAVRMLIDLRGHIHQVMTAIALLQTQPYSLKLDLCITDVPMRNYSEAEIATYVASRDPLDKAGAYAIQHAQFHPVETPEGCYANVMGLPLCHLTRLLTEAGLPPSTSVPAACQATLDYHCTTYPTILVEEE